MGLLILGILGWLVPALAAVWILNTIREMRDELRVIRRYLQMLADRPDRTPSVGKQ